MNYCHSIYQTTRFKTKEVKVGSITLGGFHPIRIQSMTTTPTHDVIATSEQIMKLADHGCEIVRVTVQGKKEAKACEHIRNLLIQKGYETPLVADIHFYPPAALEVIDFVDKIRINPGNYLDKRAQFKTILYETDQEYEQELIRLDEGLLPLILRLKNGAKALRIGVNHGSLSDRIMSRYGDTPAGMVESALEFARICRKYNYHDFVFSMKASNPLVMIKAYRLLVSKMIELGWNYPIHLGVTEAGLGEDGRIKSAVGIGSLLLDGIGDTIRVSLTEDPWNEIEPCRNILSVYQRYRQITHEPFLENYRGNEIQLLDPKHPKLHPSGSVICFYDEKKTGVKSDLKVDAFLIPREEILTTGLDHSLPVFDYEDKSAHHVFLDEKMCLDLQELREAEVIFVHIPPYKMHLARKFYEMYSQSHLLAPIILCASYIETFDDVKIHAAMELGSLLCDSIGHGIAFHSKLSYEEETSFMFNLLQACRRRQIKTEYIACPGCGRTLFPLQQITQEIQARTAHLPGVKIAVMGCIVNGPGEMADADFGYVGSKAGFVDLYVGKECAEKGIPSNIATDRLIELIKSKGRWVEKK